jgi:hypothetical protein
MDVCALLYELAILLKQSCFSWNNELICYMNISIKTVHQLESR